MNALAVHTHLLTKVFSSIGGATRAVDGLSISVPEGSIYGLLGRNSAGKTTTLRLLMGWPGQPPDQISDLIGIMDRGKLLMEGRLDEILSSFRRVTARGAALHVAGPAILHVRRNRDATQYVVKSDPEGFISELLRKGATVPDSSPLSLNEIFLELCRSEKAEEPREVTA